MPNQQELYCEIRCFAEEHSNSWPNLNHTDMFGRVVWTCWENPTIRWLSIIIPLKIIIWCYFGASFPIKNCYLGVSKRFQRHPIWSITWPGTVFAKRGWWRQRLPPELEAKCGQPQWESPWNLTESMGDLQDPESWRYVSNCRNLIAIVLTIFSGDIPWNLGLNIFGLRYGIGTSNWPSPDGPSQLDHGSHGCLPVATDDPQFIISSRLSRILSYLITWYSLPRYTIDVEKKTHRLQLAPSMRAVIAGTSRIQRQLERLHMTQATSRDFWSQCPRFLPAKDQPKISNPSATHMGMGQNPGT